MNTMYHRLIAMPTTPLNFTGVASLVMGVSPLNAERVTVQGSLGFTRDVGMGRRRAARAGTTGGAGQGARHRAAELGRDHEADEEGGQHRAIPVRSLVPDQRRGRNGLRGRPLAR